MQHNPMRRFLDNEATGGILIVVGTLVALVWANSPWDHAYDSLWHTNLQVGLGRYSFALDLHGWMNEGLMTLFFLVVGLEIKREATTGHLSSRKSLSLPLFAALGGMVVPAGLYLLIAGGTEPRGWGIPMATDIALAVGLFTVAGKGVPTSVRSFLLGLAVVDDIGAIVVIAVFYSSGVSFVWLMVGAAATLAVVVLRKVGVSLVIVYVVPGVVLWFALHEAGVHPTIAGVLLGLLAPVTSNDGRHIVEWLEHALHPWTSFLIVPIFAFANSGIDVSASSLRDASTSVIAWGILVGLVVGKPLGIVVASVASRRAGLTDYPNGATTRSLLAAGQTAGIGFTVALFIAELAIDDGSQLVEAKLAILAASILSAGIAAVLLRGKPTPTER